MRNIDLVKAGDLNVDALDRAMRARFGQRISGISRVRDLVTVHVLDYQDGDEDAAADVLAAHDPAEQTPEQVALDRAMRAPARVKAIPGWATWDEAQAVAYIENNVKDLASAKIVLVAMARLLVALRDAQWPGLDIEAERVTKK